MSTKIKRRRKDDRPKPALDQVEVGIDQSYGGFGVCILAPDGQFIRHHAKFDPEHFGQGVDRLNSIGEWFRRILYNTPQQIVHVCMEGYAPGAKFNREILGELGAVVKISLRLHPRLWDPACYPTIVAPTQVKKFACNNGNAKKEDIKLGVYKQWGAEFGTNDEADSYVLARIAAGICSTQGDGTSALAWGHGELTGYQRDILKKLKHHTER